MQLSISNDTIDMAICRYKPNPFANAVLPFTCSLIFPPMCALYYIGGYENMKEKISSHPECEKVYRDEFKSTACFATTGALTGLVAYGVILVILAIQELSSPWGWWIGGTYY